MASFDADRRRAWLRIAVDGPNDAGKRTNLQQLCHFFTTRWQVETSGRQAEHEWLQVDGGIVNGVPVLCRVCNLHGLDSECRRIILAELDALLFVCESTPRGLDRAVDALRRLSREIAPELPVVVQANKQDAPDALDPIAVARRLDLERPSPAVVGARAIVGEGVREALTEAIRLGVERIPDELFPSWAQ